MSSTLFGPKDFNEDNLRLQNIATVPLDTPLDRVIEITTSHVESGRTFRAQSQYIFTIERDLINPDCNCVDEQKEWLVEIPSVTKDDGTIIPEWAGWISSLYAVSPVVFIRTPDEVDAPGSYGRKYVNSTLPPWARKIQALLKGE